MAEAYNISDRFERTNLRNDGPSVSAKAQDSLAAHIPALQHQDSTYSEPSSPPQQQYGVHATDGAHKDDKTGDVSSVEHTRNAHIESWTASLEGSSSQSSFLQLTPSGSSHGDVAGNHSNISTFTTVAHQHDFAQDEITEQLAEEQHLEAEDEDTDSALGSEAGSTTTTLSESIFAYRREHGRTYHAYKDGKYIFPNDEREADRLDLQHHLFCITYGGKLHFAPIDRPSYALDVGTGTGIWAVDFADRFPECQVTGIDLSPGQPMMIPPNLKFIVDDAEDTWLYGHKFDYIHARLMAGCFGDWQNFFRQAYDNLEPGGWLELQDYGLPVRSADGTHLNTNIQKWGELLCEAARKLGRPMGSDACELYEQQMRNAGFVDVQQRMFMWPTSGWPKDPYMKELGRWNQVNCLEGLEGFCLALLTRALGWKREEVDIFVALVTKDFKNRSIHTYFPMPVTFGRKPRLDEGV